ncbi:MAG: hypothetical protein K6E96_00375 [Bacteroidales bacterium]|nr:hypothetical protein [Bacteroidales bacterium]
MDGIVIYFRLLCAVVELVIIIPILLLVCWLLDNFLLHGNFKKKWRIILSVAISLLIVFLPTLRNNVVEIPEMVKRIPDTVYHIDTERVIDMDYCEQDGTYYIKIRYNLDSISETMDASRMASSYTEPDGITIFCFEEDINEFLSWYAHMQHKDVYFEESVSFYIQRFITDSGYYYELEKNVDSI